VLACRAFQDRLFLQNGRRQNLELVLPKDLAPLLRMRLDIANAPVAVRLHGLALVQADGSTLWRWAGDCESLVQPWGVICLPAGGGVWLLSLNNDPQFELAIPDSVLAQVGPRARLLVEMTPQPLEEALPEVIGALQKRAEQIAAPQRAVELPPLGFAERLNELANLLKSVLDRKNEKISAQEKTIAFQEAQQQQLHELLVRAEAQLALLKEMDSYKTIDIGSSDPI